MPALGTPTTRSARDELLGLIEGSGAPLAALWVYDFAAQRDWNVTPTNGRAWQLEAVAAANRRLRAPRPGARIW